MTPPPGRPTERSAELFTRARELLPGGVDSPVRSFLSVGGSPFFVARGRGSRLTDVDGNVMIDYVMSWGPLIFGHANPGVLGALQSWLSRGTSYGAPVEQEVRLAEMVIERVPSIEMVRFVCSGTEAAMSALRLARAATGRDRLIKCDGCYHGHADSFLVKAGSGLATQGLADSAGVPADLAAKTTVVPFNDLLSVEAALVADPGGYAAIVVEPVAANMGLVLPRDGYLAGLRALADRYGALLIFDEVISGFRVAPGGAQEKYGVRPDLTILGKIIGGGLPVGAYGGRRDLMNRIAPLGPVYQAGTLSGNPLAMTAGIATLEGLSAPGVYEKLENSGRKLAEGLRAAAAAVGVPATVTQLGSLLTLFFTEGPVTDYESARRTDRERFSRFHSAMLEAGVFLPPSAFEAWFVSTAHKDKDIDATIAVASEALGRIG
jgi:glutamate-1-semialdehyde 2,1-aminomutase